jgi:hypothetical protein
VNIRTALAAGEIAWAHSFKLACAKADIDHRLAKPFHPWTNGHAECVKPCAQGRHGPQLSLRENEQRRKHLAAFVGADNFSKRLKACAGLTPF